MSVVDFPWRECSTITVEISPRYDSPDPACAPMLDFNHVYNYMSGIIHRVTTVSAILKGALQEDINQGAMAVKVIFGEC